MLTRRKLLAAYAGGLVATATLFGAPAVATETYPAGPIRMMVPYAAGGGTDAVARVVAQGLSGQLGQQVVVENNGTAGGNLATQQAAKADPDGYTVLMANQGPMTVNPHLFKNLPYDHLKDFAPVSLVAMLPNIIAVNPDFPANNVKELVTLLKKDPGKYNFAAVAGGSPHLTAEVFKEEAGVQMQLVSYKGASPAITDVMAGHVPLVFENVPLSQRSYK